jgi:beta-glucosidase
VKKLTFNRTKFRTKRIFSILLILIMVLSSLPQAVSAADLAVLNPDDSAAALRSPATFTVAVTGGEEPYTYQWQLSSDSTDGINGTWTNVTGGSGAATATYRTANATAAMTANLYRCVVTDAGGERVISAPAKLYLLSNVTASITGIGIAATEASPKARRNFAVNVAEPADYMIALNCGASNHMAESVINLTHNNESLALIQGDVLPAGTVGDVFVRVFLEAGVHYFGIDAELVSVGGYGQLQVSSMNFTDISTVAAPVLAHASGSYTEDFKTSLSLTGIWSMLGTVIFYTTDGSDPTGPSGILYDGNEFSVFPPGAPEGASVTLRAAACNTDLPPGLASAVYVLDNAPELSPPTASAPSGVLTSANARVTLSAPGSTIYYTLDGTTPTSASKRYTAPIKVLQAMTVKAIAVRPYMGTSPVAAFEYTVQAANPTAYPVSGSTVGEGSTIALTSATNAAKSTTFYYTTNGDDPTADSAAYSGPISVPILENGQSFTIKAVGTADGMISSGISTFTYTYDAITPRLTSIKSDPDFIAWKASDFTGPAPQSLKDLISDIYAVIPKTSATGGLYTLFGGASGATANGLPGSAWRTIGLSAYGIPEVAMADGPAGMRITAESNVAYERSATWWPNSTARSSTWNLELEEALGDGWGQEMKYYGNNTILAPAVNIHRSVLNGRNFEYYSEDPMLAGLVGAAEVRGIQGNGVGVSMKHFAMNNQETSRSNLPTAASKRAIREIYLRSFQYVEENSDPWTYMSAFNQINGISAAQQYDMLTTILRGEWGFDGTVMTDYGGNGNAFYNYDGATPPNAHSGLVKAGNELPLPTGNANNVRTGAESGFLTDADLKQGFERILIYVAKSPVFNDSPIAYSVNEEIKNANAAIALQTAEESAILLKNDDTALPLVKGAPGQILSLGMGGGRLYLGGTGSGGVNLTAEESAAIPTFAQAVSGLNGGNVIDASTLGLPQVASIIASGAMSSTGARTEMVIDSKIAEWRGTDLNSIIYVIQRESGENADIRADYGAYYLSTAEQNIITKASDLAAEKDIPFIVILNMGSWVEMESWKDKADAILMVWDPGQSGGLPIAKLLLGDSNPSGKLPTTVPVDIRGTDENGNLLNPSAGQFASNNVRYREGIYVGYRYYDTFRVPVSYPFGFGLSYTSFDYSDAALSKTVFEDAEDVLTASVKITNSGDVPGKEVAQFYVGAPGLSMDKPVKELKGFGKTNELIPGAAQTISADLNAMSLASFDEATGDWVVEPGEYTVYYAASSQDVKAVAVFTVEDEIIAKSVSAEAMAPRIDVDEFKPAVVSFDYNDGVTAPLLKVFTTGNPASAPASPDREGYLFAGWYTSWSDEAFDFNEPLSGSLTLMARWGLPGTYIDINPSARISMRLRTTYQLQVSTDGLTYEFTSSNPSIARVSESGLVTPVRAGTAIITVRLTDGSGFTSSATVNITP